MAPSRSIFGAHALLIPGDIMIVLGMIGICLSIVIALHDSPGQFPWDIAGGTGTVQDPYLIETCEQLQKMSKDPASSYALVQEVDCTDTSNWDNGQGFFPIGYYGRGFTGTLDGRGHSIHGFFMNRETMDYVALFGKLGTGALIRDLQMNAHVSGHNVVGSIAGWSLGGVIQNVRVDGSVNGSDSVGGIVGVNHGTIYDATFHAAVRGKKFVGGIAGVDYEGSVIQKVDVSGDIAGEKNVGGVVGVSRGSVIDSCNVTANVLGVANVGGVAGWIIGGNHMASSIKNCAFRGTVHGEPSGPIYGMRGV